MTKIGSLLFLMVLVLAASCSKTTDSLTVADQLIKDTQTIDDYLTANKITAIKDDSGLRYVVTSQGTGSKPSLYSNVNVNYTGKFLDNSSIFDKSSSAVTFTLYNVIQGWQIGLPYVNKGSKVTLYIPSGLAYGSLGSGDGTVQPNTNLIFDIELLDESAQLQADIATIDKYLDSLKITAVKDASGIRYNVTGQGAGSKPSITNTVYFTYSGKLLKTGVVFGQSSTTVSSYLGTMAPPGLQTGMQKLQVGSTATFYIPSSLAFGLNSSTDSGITPNSNLIYTIELTSIQ